MNFRHTLGNLLKCLEKRVLRRCTSEMAGSCGSPTLCWGRLRGITDSMDTSWSKAPGAGDGQGGLACCSPRGRRESDTAERLNNNLTFPVRDKLYIVGLGPATVWRPRM